MFTMCNSVLSLMLSVCSTSPKAKSSSCCKNCLFSASSYEQLQQEEMTVATSLNDFLKGERGSSKFVADKTQWNLFILFLFIIYNYSPPSLVGLRVGNNKAKN